MFFHLIYIFYSNFLISNQTNNEEKNDIPWIKMFYSSYQNESLNNLANEKMHLAMLTLHEFFNIYRCFF